MNLIDESYNNRKSSKNIFFVGIIGIIILLLIIVVLLVYASTMNNNATSLVIDNNKYSVQKHLMTKDDVVYIGIEDLTKLTKNDYSYKNGDKDSENDDKCYIINAHESTFFELNSKEIYKISEDTNEIDYYILNSPIIKENGIFYISLDDIQVAFNVRYLNNNNKLNIMSIGYLEGFYNKQTSNNFLPDDSIVWETTYANKKLLKEGLVVIKDENNKLGIAIITSNTDSKSKTTKVSTNAIINPKYDEIYYLEKYNQLVVKTENGKGIIQLNKENGNYSAKTLILPQFDDIRPINDTLYLVTKKGDSNQNKYGIVDVDGDPVLASEYDEIGIDISDFINNHLDSGYIVYKNLIPVRKDNKYGFVNLSGKVVIDTAYDELGCAEANSSSNVLIIPDIEGIVVKQNNGYGIITKTEKVLVKCVLTRIYKENSNGKEKYIAVYNNKKFDIVNEMDELLKEIENKENTAVSQEQNQDGATPSVDVPEN